MQLKKNSVRTITYLALLTALQIVLSRFLSINTSGLKIGFAFVPVVVAAILFGPISAAIVNALADFLGAILFPIGPYHPGFTICAALAGILYGLFLYKSDSEATDLFSKPWIRRKTIRFFPNVLVPVLVNSLILGLLVNTIWVAMLYGSKTYAGWFLYRLPEYALMVPVRLVLIPVLLRLCVQLKKVFIKTK
ncbi:MAG: folate family ECF transporter S component [Eubacteriales bacterium]